MDERQRRRDSAKQAMLDWAWSQPCPASSKLVLLRLAYLSHDAESAQASGEALAEATCLNRKTLLKAIKQLEMVRLIRVDRAGRNNLYFLNMYD